MGYRLLGFAAALLMLSLSAQQTAEAKPPRYIITGGELGAYAAHIEPIHGDPFSVQLPGEDSRGIVAPERIQGLTYVIWQPFGYLDLVPVLVYYPESGLIRMERSGDWYQAGRSTVAMLDDAIDQALKKMEANELEDGVISAQLRAMRFPEASFLLRPFAAPGDGYSSQGSGECARCTLLPGPNETFVMVDLAEVLDGPLVGPAPEVPPYAIEFEVPGAPSGKVTGLLGMYRPPELGGPGQFWLQHYSRDMLYRETTPGFDAVIAEALERSEEWDATPSDGAQVDTDSGGKVSMWWFWTGGLASGVTVLLAGSTIFYRRRAA